MVMLLLSVGLLFFVGVGLTASAFGRLIFLFSSSSLASSSKVVREFDDTDLLMERGLSIPLIESFLLLSSWLTLSREVFLLLPSTTWSPDWPEVDLLCSHLRMLSCLACPVLELR